MSPNWKNIPFSAGLATEVPPDSGIYAIARVRRVLRLPVDLSLLYVGQSRDLRRRFRDHAVPWRRGSRALKQLPDSESWEFWYRRFPEDLLDEAERHLIRTAEPVINIIRYGEPND